jgi:hypothetical protein
MIAMTTRSSMRVNPILGLFVKIVTAAVSFGRDFGGVAT